jgi:hypothetical protein
MDLTFNLPVNSVSFGVTSIALLREIFNKQEEIQGLFPIGQVDMSAQKPYSEFSAWMQNSINNSVLKHTKDTPVLRLWHILQSLEGVKSNNNALFTFHETSGISDVEKHILNQQDKIFVSSPYTKQVFESGGVTTPVVLCPLGFDSFNLYKKNKKYYHDNRIVWGLNGKAEARKGTYRVLNLWAKKYGNNKNHMLHCLISNPFIGQMTGNPNLEGQLIGQALEGKHYDNIVFLPYQKNINEVNDILNVQDINLDGLSLCEGFNYGLFNSLCLGKQAVVLNSHVHKVYCNPENSILVESAGMIDAEDGFFFKKGNIINTGMWDNWNENDVSDSMDLAAGRAKILNTEGEKLKDEFTFYKTLDIIAKNLK